VERWNSGTVSAEAGVPDHSDTTVSQLALECGINLACLDVRPRPQGAKGCHDERRRRRLRCGSEENLNSGWLRYMSFKTGLAGTNWWPDCQCPLSLYRRKLHTCCANDRHLPHVFLAGQTQLRKTARTRLGRAHHGARPPGVVNAYVVRPQSEGQASADGDFVNSWKT